VTIGWWWRWVLMGVLVLGACSDFGGGESGRPLRSGSGPERSPVAKTVDLTDLAAGARRSFRATGTEFEATGPRHRGVLHGRALVVTAARRRSDPVGPAGLKVELDEVRRGSVRVAGSDAEPTRLRPDGSLATELGASRQIHRNTADGVELSWEFDRPPGTAGDLVVRVRVTGQTFVSANGTGLHFRDQRSGLGTRYGHGTWIDGAGKKTHIPATFRDDLIELSVPHGVAASSTYPAVLDPLISPEFGIDQPMPGDPPYYAWDIAVARAGQTYLVVWRDERIYDSRGFYGARIDAATGQLLDPTGFPIAYSVHSPSLTHELLDYVLASNGQEFLFVWREARGSEIQARQSSLYARRIRTDGTMLDGPLTGGGIPIATALQEGDTLAAAYFDESQYWVTWLGGTALRGTRLHAQTAELLQGTPDSAGVVLMPRLIANVAFAKDASSVLVVHGSQFKRFSPDGTALDAAPRLFSWQPGTTTPLTGWVTAGFDGTNYVVVQAGRMLSRIEPDGTVLDPPDDFNLLPGGIELCEGGYSALGSARLVLRPGVSLLLGIGFNEDFRGSRIDTALGTLLDGPVGTHCGKALPLLTRDPVVSLGLADGPDGFLAAIGNHARRFDFNLDPVGQTGLATGTASPQDGASVASNGTDYLVAWLDARSESGDTDVYAARIRADGTVLDPIAFPLSTVRAEASSVAVASNGTDYMVTWLTPGTNSRHRIRGTRVSAAGIMLDGTPGSDGVVLDQTSSGDEYRDVAIGSDGTNYLVVWNRVRATSRPWEVQGVRFDSSGTPLDGGRRLAIANDSNVDGYNVHVVADRAPDPTRRTYLVAWEEEESASIRYQRIVRAARVRSALGVHVGEVTLSTIGQDARFPAIASDGTDFLVGWQQPVRKPNGSNFESDKDILAARISALDGLVSDAGGRAVGASTKEAESATFAHNGRHYWASWVEHKPREVDQSFFNDPSIMAIRLDSSGATLDGSPQAGAFPVGTYPFAYGTTNRVRIASNGAGKVLAVYTAFDERATARQRRVLARFLEDTPEEIDGGIVYQPDAAPDTGTHADAADASDAGAGDAAGNDAPPSGGAAGAGGQGGSSTGGTGAIGTGGTGGASGAAGAGGVVGAAGSAGAAGSLAGGAGGTPGDAGAKDSGSAGTRNDPPQSPSSDESDGCGCRVESRPESSGLGVLLIAALFGLARARRRRAARRSADPITPTTSP
jgi:large repetitive protein